MKRVLVVVSQPPLAVAMPRERMDLALAAAAMDHPLQVLFIGDGVLHCRAPRSAGDGGPAGLAKSWGAVAALTDLPLLAVAGDLQRHGLNRDDLVDWVQPADEDACRAALQAAEVVLHA